MYFIFILNDGSAQGIKTVKCKKIVLKSVKNIRQNGNNIIQVFISTKKSVATIYIINLLNCVLTPVKFVFNINRVFLWKP